APPRQGVGPGGLLGGVLAAQELLEGAGARQLLEAAPVVPAAGAREPVPHPLQLLRLHRVSPSAVTTCRVGRVYEAHRRVQKRIRLCKGPDTHEPSGGPRRLGPPYPTSRPQR